MKLQPSMARFPPMPTRLQHSAIFGTGTIPYARPSR
ncbi:hypothetical protein N7463_004198 [Penicillium fimorum]|uniref:Uncharacterized protein n=1 Tax=Penicillium fimorum TaxID=1882269 RepID=A0A9W9Y2J0_9EURO|nr:hypothetical protein N7463_004198 [Penicillium fimorum]